MFFAKGFVAVFAFYVEGRFCSAFGTLDHHQRLLALEWLWGRLSVFLHLLRYRAVVPFEYQLLEYLRARVIEFQFEHSDSSIVVFFYYGGVGQVFEVAFGGAVALVRLLCDLCKMQFSHVG